MKLTRRQLLGGMIAAGATACTTALADPPPWAHHQKPSPSPSPSSSGTDFYVDTYGDLY